MVARLIRGATLRGTIIFHQASGLFNGAEPRSGTTGVTSVAGVTGVTSVTSVTSACLPTGCLSIAIRVTMTGRAAVRAVLETEKAVHLESSGFGFGLV